MKYIEKQDRPWGKYYVIHDEENYKLKRIEVLPGGRLSYQFHDKRSEAWSIVEGSGIVTLEDNDLKVSYGDTVTIKRQQKHRIFNNTDSLLVFIEVQMGTYFGEDDIVRIQDDYKRE
jgi:mannose-6-phosphate isomerase